MCLCTCSVLWVRSLEEVNCVCTPACVHLLSAFMMAIEKCAKLTFPHFE